MTDDKNKVLVLDLAPRRKKLLSLWNPLDYIVLCYWAYFFPQALCWYVERFGDSLSLRERGAKAIWNAFWDDKVQRSLIMMGFIFAVILPAAIVWWLGVHREFPALPVLGAAAVGVVFGSIVSIKIAKNSAFFVAGLFSMGFITALLGSYMANLPLKSHDAFEQAVKFPVGVFLAALLAYRYYAPIVDSMKGGIQIAIARNLGGMLILATACSLPIVFLIWHERSELAGSEVAVLIFVVLVFYPCVLVIFPFRILGWIVLSPFPARMVLLHRCVWLPFQRLRAFLEFSLESDWGLGLRNVEQVLAYSSQFIPAVEAVKTVLEGSSGDELFIRVIRVGALSEDWVLVRFGSASLRRAMWAEVLAGIYILYILPGGLMRRWESRLTELRLDTPSGCACAGFWLWHEGYTDRAAEAFSKLRAIRFGEEIYQIALAITEAERSKDLSAISTWVTKTTDLKKLPSEQLRPAVVATLGILRRVSAEVSAAMHALAPLSRSAALNRGLGELKRLLDAGDSICPAPEAALLRRIAQSWLDVLLRSAGEVGEAVLRQSVANPYEGYSGLPVSGSVFVGRHAAMREIETCWAAGDVLPVVILYGHRRMGKTSILRNLEHVAGAKTILVYLDMQDAGWIDHTGQLLLDLAEAVHRRTSDAGLDPGPQPLPERYASLGEARRELNALLDRLAPQMTGHRLILAVDEFELVERGMADGRIDAGFLPYLRAIHQRYRWLALIFGGLHTLDELGRDYQSTFYGQAEHIRVGYLAHDDAIHLITQPHPDFALEYSPALREELFRLTYGQPFLIQRVCWELVNRWNERFLAAGEGTLRTLELDDLAAVLTDDLYAGAAYYFDGVWSNVTEAERRIMEVMASREETWERTELVAASGGEDLEPALGLLRRHDVIVEEGETIRFASELMRRWVERQTSGRAS